MSEFDTLIHEGTKAECEMVLRGLVSYGVLARKLRIVEPPKWLSESTREKAIKSLADDKIEGSFGDGLERDYVLDGNTMVGLNELSDDELLEEYESYNDLDLQDELLMEMRAQKSIYEDVLNS